jgi:hypothetical protein
VAVKPPTSAGSVIKEPPLDLRGQQQSASRWHTWENTVSPVVFSRNRFFYFRPFGNKRHTSHAHSPKADRGFRDASAIVSGFASMAAAVVIRAEKAELGQAGKGAGFHFLFLPATRKRSMDVFRRCDFERNIDIREIQ